MAQSELIEQLKEEGISVEQDILQNVINLVDELRLGGEDLVAEWQSFSLNKKNAVSDESTIDQSAFRVFSKHLRVSQSARCAKKTKSRSNRFGVHSKASLQPLMERMSTPSKPRGKQREENEALFDALMTMQTPSKSSTPSNPSISCSAVKAMPERRSRSLKGSDPLNSSLMASPAPTQSRSSGGGKVIETLNGSLPPNTDRLSSAVAISVVAPLPSGDGYPWNEVAVSELATDEKARRFMAQDVHSAQSALRERVEFIGQHLMAQIRTLEGSDDAEFSALDEPSQRECWFLGRLQNDGDDSGGSAKVTAGNVVLESVEGIRCRLNLSALSALSLFPGQIVAVHGVRSSLSGGEVAVSKLLSGAGYAVKKTVDSAPRPLPSTGTLKVVVAAGPFTRRDSVQFEGSTLHSLARRVAAERPNVVVLMGPFTDSENEMVQSGRIEVTLEALFENLLSAFLGAVGEDHAMRTVVVPSTKDLHHFGAFPQRPFRGAARPNVHFVGNPAQLALNNVTLGLCSADLLLDVCRLGHTKNIKDRLLALMGHAVDQQSFYPLQPAAKELRMDYDRHRSLYIHRHLDVLAMPSQLRHFAKIHKDTDTVCLNPSYLTRVNSPGTFAMLHIEDSDDYTVTDYTDRIRVDIHRV